MMGQTLLALAEETSAASIEQLESEIHALECEIAGATAVSGRNWKVYVGDVLSSLRRLPSGSVHCVVTSPPYYGLRKYIDDDAPEKEHEIGLEKTPAEFLAKLVEVFEEIRRVLRDDGTCWVNMGDTYAGGGRGPAESDSTLEGSADYQNHSRQATQSQRRDGAIVPRADYKHDGFKPKDLMGMPWRLAFALQDAGWYLRQDIIWHKRSPMPESVTDRCTKSHEYIFKFSKDEEYFQAGLIQDHEYVFLLAKQQQYFYDAEAIREAGSRVSWSVQKFKGGDLATHHKSSTAAEALDPTAGRNCRSVWTMSTEPLRVKHFAAFPSALPARCIKAGTSEKGCCAKCGAPWVRIVETERVATRPGTDSKTYNEPGNWQMTPGTHKSFDYNTHEMRRAEEIGNRDPLRHVSIKMTTGWQPSCECNAECVPCTVLDPFSGTGTTGLAATELGRDYIGCELNETYALASEQRIESWKTRDVERQVEPSKGQMNLFE